jgi:Flp pilus assembly protein TadG
MRIRHLLRDTHGAAATEFAIALPLLAVFMIGVLQFGQILQTNGALRNALGDGIRYAKVHPTATSSEVLDQTRAGLAGVALNGIKSLTFQRGTQNGADYGQISISYQLHPIMPFVPLPPITLSQTKTAYLPS